MAAAAPITMLKQSIQPLSQIALLQCIDVRHCSAEQQSQMLLCQCKIKEITASRLPRESGTKVAVPYA